MAEDKHLGKSGDSCPCFSQQYLCWEPSGPAYDPNELLDSMSKMPLLCRYAGLRAAEPLSVLADGRLLDQFNGRWCDETTRVIPF